MLSYYVIWYEKFRKVMQRTAKVVLNGLLTNKSYGSISIIALEAGFTMVSNSVVSTAADSSLSVTGIAFCAMVVAAAWHTCNKGTPIGFRPGIPCSTLLTKLTLKMNNLHSTTITIICIFSIS